MFGGGKIEVNRKQARLNDVSRPHTQVLKNYFTCKCDSNILQTKTKHAKHIQLVVQTTTTIRSPFHLTAATVLTQNKQWAHP